MQIATIVIPNLNGKKYLADCFDSLRAQSRQDFSVILIDNGSVDGSAEFVKEEYPGSDREVLCKESGLLRSGPMRESE